MRTQPRLAPLDVRCWVLGVGCSSRSVLEVREIFLRVERRRAAFKARRDYFIPELQQLGLNVPVMPDGAFYAWADGTQAATRLGVQGSWDLAYALMDRAHLAVTPGRDFGTHEPERFLRFSTASSMAHLQSAAQRLQALLA